MAPLLYPLKCSLTACAKPRHLAFKAVLRYSRREPKQGVGELLLSSVFTPPRVSTTLFLSHYNLIIFPTFESNPKEISQDGERIVQRLPCGQRQQ